MFDDIAYYQERAETLRAIQKQLWPEYQFRPITVSFAPLLKRYQPNTRLSSRCLLSLYAYAGEDDMLYWEDEELEYLCIIYIGKDNRLCAYPPLGTYRANAYARMVERMDDIFRRAGVPLRLEHVDPAELPHLEALQCRPFTITSSPDDEDYIYTLQSLMDFDGHHNYNRRMNRNKFLRRHLIRSIRITDAHMQDCFKVMEGWCAQRSCTQCGFRCPYQTAQRALKHLDALDAWGILMYMDEEPESVVLLGDMGGGMADLMSIFSKSRNSGETYCLMEEVAKLCPSHVQSINLEEDLGIESLRRFKQALHPTEMLKKYTALLQMDDIRT